MLANGSPTRVRTRVRRACALLLALLAHRAVAGQPDHGPDLSALPLEQLLAMEVYSASKFVQQASQAPSTVSVITAADIQTFGWRTLADVLRSVRGLYVAYDRNYSYLGARSFLRPGDYNTRFLLQIDGNRINDGVYDQAPIGAEFPLDLELIERIEYAPGPGSSIYGANAFFGVINVITKNARTLDGVRASVEAGQYGARRGSSSLAWSDAQGNSLLLAASRYTNDGRDLYFREFDHPAQNAGVAQGRDFETGQRLYAKGISGPFSLSLTHAERTKGVPTASFSQAFNDSRSRTFDHQNYLDFAYRMTLAGQAELTARAFWGSYHSTGDYVNDDPARSLNRDGSYSRWWGADIKLVSTPALGHKVVMGAEYQNDYTLSQFSYIVDPYALLLADMRSGQRMGLYLQDELRLTDALLLNAGMRYDRRPGAGGVLNPRLALIYQATPATTLKAMFGSAFREPNSYELHYAAPNPGGQLANASLRRERIRSKELALVHQLADGARLTVTAFQNTVSALISQTTDPASGMAIFENAAPLRARGVEAEYERNWSAAASLRASISWQKVSGASGPGVDAPALLAKFNLAAPLWRSAWRSGVEAQYVGQRATLAGRTGGFWLANLNVFSTRLTRHWDGALGVGNLFDRRYADPASDAFRQDTLVQDGRSLRLTITYAQ
ncbi:MAG: TonB-dependent receptor [Massilia sp.]|nr:TonB-dependent receptor [Massilia sp.]